MATREQPTRAQHADRNQTADEQEVIDEVGKEGTVRTSGGETSVGTTPIGVGSVEPVGGHREASDRIMGEQPDEADAGRGQKDRDAR